MNFKTQKFTGPWIRIALLKTRVWILDPYQIILVKASSCFSEYPGSNPDPCTLMFWVGSTVLLSPFPGPPLGLSFWKPEFDPRSISNSSTAPSCVSETWDRTLIRNMIFYSLLTFSRSALRFSVCVDQSCCSSDCEQKSDFFRKKER